MRTVQQQRNYEKLELLPPQIGTLVSLGLRQLWQTCLAFWNSEGDEPDVRQDVDRFGNVYWQVYDPTQDCMLSFDNERNLLIWLDERPYRNAQSKSWL